MTSRFHEFLVRSFLLNFAIGEDVDLLDTHDAGKTVSAVDYGLSLQHFLQLLGHTLLSLGIQVAGSLVE